MQLDVEDEFFWGLELGLPAVALLPKCLKNLAPKRFRFSRTSVTGFVAVKICTPEMCWMTENFLAVGHADH